MRKIIFVLLAFIGLSFGVQAQSTTLDLAVENNTGEILSNISFTSPLQMRSYNNLAAGGGLVTDNFTLDRTQEVTITIFFSTVPRGAVARIYNSNLNTPDGTLNIQPGLNIFHLSPTISDGAIIVVIN
ncbi:hypothetical protein CLV59_107337 [Chitinophaga dinghuensis]|uniref:Uncharacterized protein n=1 Tax=Chitinophaga dinghuensis TaxID=1539050 RepID=A0A327VU39_9BACT|nr:hypothetical protein [Chitinophaga dinghuensis]RAJ77570.1 hypothetical protein CLV59_107337 [Chitinophaga dinghuensis]